jgi:hypothetical protein
MTDFFDDLERQLVEAATERPRRLRRARARHGAVLATVLVAVLACGAGLATALSGGGTGGDPGTPMAPTGGPIQTVTVAPDSGRITGDTTRFTVAILNGTTVPGLARGVANQLQNAHFKVGNITNAADQGRSATSILYAPGRRAEARAVASVLSIAADAVQPVDRANRVIAGERASVVVVVGADLNTSPQRNTRRRP